MGVGRRRERPTTARNGEIAESQRQARMAGCPQGARAYKGELLELQGRSHVFDVIECRGVQQQHTQLYLAEQRNGEGRELCELETEQRMEERMLQSWARRQGPTLYTAIRAHLQQAQSYCFADSWAHGKQAPDGCQDAHTASTTAKLGEGKKRRTLKHLEAPLTARATAKQRQKEKHSSRGVHIVHKISAHSSKRRCNRRIRRCARRRNVEAIDDRRSRSSRKW